MRESIPELVTGDAFGGVLRACHEAGARKGAVFQIIERDDGHIAASDASVYFAPAEDWPELERQACEEITGRVLDVGCGAGRHASVLTAEGVEVIGLDSSPGAVAVARARGVDARLGSASAIPAGIDAVDTFVLFGNGIGLLGSRQQARVVLAELARVAAPGPGCSAPGTTPTRPPIRATSPTTTATAGLAACPANCAFGPGTNAWPRNGSTICSPPRRN
jgi:SAM-dependent methyltransferase